MDGGYSNERSEINIIIKRKVFYIILVSVMLGCLICTVIFLNKNPLVVTGFTKYDNGRKKIDIQIKNKGNSNITIQEIQVNDKSALQAQLVISYTGQLVAGGIDDNPRAKFLRINEKPIHPQPSPEEVKQVDHTYSTPINYGVRIFNDSDIETIKIKYKYLGISFVRETNLDTWPQ